MSQTQSSFNLSTANFSTAIQDAMADFERAANAGDAAALAEHYTDDATLLPPGSPRIEGRSSIRAFWQAFLAAGAGEASLHTVSIESYGPLAYEIGSYEATVPDAGGARIRSEGKYLAVWKRTDDGRVRMVADMFGPNA